MKRKTARKKFTAKVKAFKEWLKKARTMKTADLWETVKAKLRGHYAYYGVTDNLSRHQEISRRSQKAPDEAAEKNDAKGNVSRGEIQGNAGAVFRYQNYGSRSRCSLQP